MSVKVTTRRGCTVGVSPTRKDGSPMESYLGDGIMLSLSMVEVDPTDTRYAEVHLTTDEARVVRDMLAQAIGMLDGKSTAGETDHFCRSQSPKGDPCERRRGHKGERHRMSAQDAKRFGRSTRFWTGGIRTEARWYVEDDGYMSQADMDTWGRIFR